MKGQPYCDVLVGALGVGLRGCHAGLAFYPLVIGELFDLRTVVAHDEDFTVRLRRSDQHRLRL